MRRLLFFPFWVFLISTMAIADEADFLGFTDPINEEEITIYKSCYQEFLEGLSESDNPTILVIGGGPGSGKTTWRNFQSESLKNVHLHDMDEVLIRLPGYQRDVRDIGVKEAFENWWPTARKIADKLVQYAIQCRYSILYERSCGAEGSYFDLLTAKQQGYRIDFVGLFVDADVACQRILIRSKKINRTISSDIIEEYRARFSALWPYYIKIADSITLYDSTEGLKMIFSNGDILDEDRYQSFLTEGKDFWSYFSEKILGK